MKADRKTKVEQSPPVTKTGKKSRRAAPKTNGKYPLATYEHIPIGIVEGSMEGKYIDVNEEFCRILGYSRDELLELGIKDCTHEDDYSIDSKLYEQLITGKIPFYRLEKQYIRKGGGPIWVELTRTLVCDERGKPRYTVGVVLDISDRKDVEKVLRESVERLRLATETARMFMWEWDFQTQSYVLADNFEQVLGFSVHLLPKNSFETLRSLIPAEDVQAVSEAFKNAVQNRQDLHTVACRVIYPEAGHVVWLEISAKIVYDPEGNPKRMFGVAQNINESKKAEEALQLARSLAEQSVDRTARLQKVTAALSETLTPLQIAEVLTKQGASALGAVSSSIMLLSSDGQTLEILYSTSSESLVGTYKQFPVSLQVPVADAARSGKSVWIESQQQFLERYPQLSEHINLWGQQAAIAIPMAYKEHMLGVFALSFDRPLPYNAEDQEYALTLAQQGAQSLDRVRAENALRESEERFRALVSQTTAGIAESDMNSRLVFANPRFCEMLGYSEKELLGKTIWELTYTDDLEKNKRLFKRMLRSGEPYQLEKRFVRRDGSTLWTNASVTTVYDTSGKPKGGVGVMIDIEKRKRAEGALTEFARQQSALYKLSERLHRADSLEDVYNAALDAILSALQCDRASILLYDHTDVMHFVVWRGLSDKYRNATDGHSPWTPDVKDPQPISLDDIRTADLDESLRAIIQAEGIGALAFVPLVVNEKLIGKFMIYYNAPHSFNNAELDLSLTIAHQLAFGIDRKRADEKILRLNGELQAQLDEMNSLLEILPTGVWIGNEDCSEITGNAAAYQMLGLSPGINVSSTNPRSQGTQGIHLFVNGEETRPENSPMQTVARTGKSMQNFEHEIRFPDGTSKTMYASIVPLFDQHGTIRKVIGTYTDVTERKQTEKRLALLAEISEMLRNVEDPYELLYTIAKTVGEHLHVKRVLFNEIDFEHDKEIVHRDYHNGLESVAGIHKVSDYSGITSKEVATGKTVVNMDSKLDPRTAQDYERTYALTGERSYVVVPMMRDNRWVASLWASDDVPRSWTNEEISLLETVAERTWIVIEKLRINVELRESEERYRAVVESQAEMLCRFKPDGTILFVNEAYARARGTTADRLIQDNFWEFVAEADRPAVRAMLESLTPEQPETRIENRFETVEGERWTLWTNRALRFDESGHPMELQSSGTDITDRKRAEQDLRESEERYRFIVENTSDGIWWIELTKPMPLSLPEDEQVEWYYDHAVIRQCNLGLARMYGFDSVEEALGLPLRVVMPREQSLNRDMLRQFIRSGYRLVDTETREIGRDGRELVFLNNMIGIVEDGMLKGEWGTNRDITERNRAEAALRESEERYRGIVNQTIAGIAEIDLTGKFIMVNDRYCEITGYPGEELLHGMRMQDITHPDDVQRTTDSFERLIADGTSFEIEKRYIRRQGSTVWVHNSVSAITDADGQPRTAVVAVLDVTERKRAEETMRRNEELFATLVESAPFGVYFIDSEFRLRAINKGSEAVFRGIEPLIGRDFAEILRIVWQEPFATEAIEHFRHTLRTGEAFISPPTIEPRANIEEIQSYDWQIHRITMPDGTYGVVCYFYDLSEQKRMEARVRASESLYRAIARNIPGGGLYVVDRDFRYLVAEGPVTEAFGLTPEMLEGRTVTEAFPDERGARMEERLRRTFTGETVSFETNFNGRVYWTQQAPLHESIGQAIILTLDITERKQVEDALRRSEERFARFMQQLPGLAWIKDMEGRYVYANAAAESAFGTSLDQLYGRTDEDIFPAEVAAQFKQNDEQALRDEKGIQVVETLPQNDGILHYSLVSKFAIPGPDGNAVLVGGTAFDITERRRAEEALRESEERFRAILRQATAGIVRKDAHGRLIFVNQAFCNMLGYTESELLGQTIWDLMHEDDIDENKRSYERLMKEGVPFKLERRLLREDGSVIWVDASVSPIMDADGKPQSAVTVEVDITARRQAEEALHQLNLQLEERVLSRTAKLRAVNQTLREEIVERKRVEEALRQSEATARENEEKLSTLFELLPVGISFLDSKGQIIQMNSALTNILKLTKEQLLDREYQDRTYIRSNGTLMPSHEFASLRAFAEGQTVYNVETGVVLEDSDVIWTSVSAAPVAVADVGAVVVTTDITESKRAERALQESRERLQFLSQRLVEVQEEERRAIARELHDRVGQTLAALNINLIIISGQLGDKADEQTNTRLNDSMKLVAETISLVRDVMSNLRPSVLDDYGLEAAIESYLSQFISRYEIGVKFEKPDQPLPRLGPSIEMTFLRIAQEALMNIVKHAQASQVILSLQREAAIVYMTVQDNGLGFASWQDANRSGSHGLTIMRERAEAFGGSLNVNSVPGKGTTVEVKIPIETNDPSQTEEHQ